MEAADFVDEVADKIWADPRQKHDEVFADEMPAKEAAANRVEGIQEEWYQVDGRVGRIRGRPADY